MRKRWSICLVLLAVILLFVGCSAPKEAETPQESLPSAVDLDDTGDTSFRPTLMYMADANGYLVPVMQQIPWEEGIAKATLSQIVVGAESAGAQKAGLTGILPKGTKVDLDISKDGVATVGLSKEALELKDALAEQNMIAGVVNTLLEFPTIKSVLIKVDGVTDGKLPHGTSIKEPFTEQKVNLENSQGVDVNTASSVQVYFQSESGLLVPTTALVDQNPSLTVALTRLTEGPSAAGTLQSVLPEGTQLLDASIGEGVAILNFSKEMASILDQEDGGAAAARAVTLTALQFPEVQEVFIRVEGEALDVQTTVPTFANML